MTPPGTPVSEVRRPHKRCGASVAVDDVSSEVTPGSCPDRTG